MATSAAQKRYFQSEAESENATNTNMKSLADAQGHRDQTSYATKPPADSQPLEAFNTYYHRMTHHPRLPNPIYTDDERQREQQQLGRQDGVTFAGSGHFPPGGPGYSAASCIVNEAPAAGLYSHNYNYGNGDPNWSAQTQAAHAAYWCYYQQWYAASQYQRSVPQPSAWWPVQYQYPLTQPYFAGGQVQQQLQPQLPFTQTRYPLRNLNASVPAFTPVNQPQPQQPVSVTQDFSGRLQQTNGQFDVSLPARTKTAKNKAKKDAKKLQQTLPQAAYGKRGPNTGRLQPQTSSAKNKMTMEPADDNGHRSTKQTERIHVLPRPVPSASYIDRALQPPRAFDFPRPLLVVLDLNGTLLFRKKHGGSNKFVARPHVHAFLNYLFSNHSVMVWSSARLENVTKMCSDLFTPKQNYELVATWGRDKLRLPSDAYWQKVQVYKQLTWVWYDRSIQVMNPRIGIESWDQSNTVLIDDSIEKAASEPHNLIQIDEFEGKEEQMQDEVLRQVEQYLDTLRSQQNVSAYIRAKPFECLPVNATPFKEPTKMSDEINLDAEHRAQRDDTFDRTGTPLQQP